MIRTIYRTYAPLELSVEETDASSTSYPKPLEYRWRQVLLMRGVGMHHLFGCPILIGPRLRDGNRKISQIGAADFPNGLARICGEGLIRGCVQEGDHPISFSARIRMGVVLKRECERTRAAHPCHLVFLVPFSPCFFTFSFREALAPARDLQPAYAASP